MPQVEFSDELTEGRPFFQIFPDPDRDAQQFLGKEFQPIVYVRRFGFQFLKSLEEEYGGQNPVAGGLKVPQDRVAALLAPENGSGSFHLPVNEFVADIGPGEAHPPAGQRFFQPQIVHDGADDDAVEFGFGLGQEPGDGKDRMFAVEDSSQ